MYTMEKKEGNRHNSIGMGEPLPKTVHLSGKGLGLSF
jgi:hypothetical protein